MATSSERPSKPSGGNPGDISGVEPGTGTQPPVDTYTLDPSAVHSFLPQISETRPVSSSPSLPTQAAAAAAFAATSDESPAGPPAASSPAAAQLLVPQALEQKLSRCTDASCRDRPRNGDRGPEDEAPPDRISIGHAAWGVLHTAAATWKDDTSVEKQQRMQEWVRSFAALFPCSQCRQHFKPFIQKNPPATSGGRRSLSLWACQAHNFVNEDLGRPLFKCDEAELLRQWRETQWKDDDDDE
ncbi:erv1 alr family protein [Cystoisospora suis]|uniref:Sulfhydryl oxidase n=1 Tax=Cystoisospora suis TaxID=483139 RepID=A0A2C6LE28_9APIC|nr:erv1 alr family protein [Cystoisospora suis]